MSLQFLWTPPKSLWRFFANAIVLFLLLTPMWMQVSKWTSYPVAGLTQMVLNVGAGYWVRAVNKEPGRIEVETRIQVQVPGSNSSLGVAELVAEADPARYAYGLPLFLALLLAARSKRWWKKALIGYLLLLIPQTFSLVLEILRQIMVAGGRPGALAVDQWQLEAIAIGYQAGSLLLPALAPLALWLWLDQDFFDQVVAQGWRNRRQKGN
ncbi:MAG TPA: hypothetical protein PLB25_12985 [Rhodoferax sp.]|nr:hypothetical protein [Rhodoferax sp.]